MISSKCFAKCLVIAALLASPASAFARDTVGIREGLQNETPEQLKGVGITEHLGETIDLDAPFTDHNGQPATLRQYVANGKPVFLSLAYYSCPSLCNYHLNGALDSFRKIPQPLGQEFNAVVISVEPKETAEIAKAKRQTYLDAYGRPEGEKGWHFLVGAQASIDKITKQVGFNYHWDEKQQQWAHASVAVIVTPDGRISRYLYGIVFDPKTVRLSMVEASSGQIGTVIDKLILFCFHFDPTTSKYSLYAFNVMRGGAVLILLLMGIFIAPFWIRSSRRQLSGDAT
ncbi:MAG: SCO family protein [Bdellovibrionota bacterium]